MAYLAHLENPSILCDSTVFSDMATSAQATQSISSPKPASGSGTNTRNAPIFPVLPPAHNFSVLGNPARFPDYIASQLPLANENAPPSNYMHPPLSPVTLQSAANTSGKIRSNVNSNFLNTLLRYRDREQIIGPSTWSEDVFPDTSLPQAYLGRNLLKNPIIRLWDHINNKISATGQPKDMTEGEISRWLNYLAANLLEAHGMHSDVPAWPESQRPGQAAQYRPGQSQAMDLAYIGPWPWLEIYEAISHGFRPIFRPS